MHAGCPVLVGEKIGANIWLDRIGGMPMLTKTAAHENEAADSL